MKIKLLIITVLAPVIAVAQTPNFTISGKIGNLNVPAKIYLDYSSDGTGHTDSVVLVNGVFKFTGFTANISSARMTLSREGNFQKEVYGKGTGDVIYPFFGKETIQINSGDSLRNAKWTGSRVYNELLKFDKAVGPTVMTVHHNANVALERATQEQQKDTAFFKSIDAKVKALMVSRGSKLLAFAESNPSSYFALRALSESLSNYSVNAEIIRPKFDKLSQELRTSDSGQSLGKLISSSMVTEIGDIAPDFTQQDMNGKPTSLADFKGKVVLVEFWASWCHPCREESPNLLKQYALFKEKGFEILSVSLDTDKNRWLEAIKKDGLTWTQVSDLKGWNNQAGKLYGISGVPANFLVSKDGKIIAAHLRGEELNKILTEVFR